MSKEATHFCIWIFYLTKYERLMNVHKIYDLTFTKTYFNWNLWKTCFVMLSRLWHFLKITTLPVSMWWFSFEFWGSNVHVYTRVYFVLKSGHFDSISDVHFHRTQFFFSTFHQQYNHMNMVFLWFSIPCHILISSTHQFSGNSN